MTSFSFELVRQYPTLDRNRRAVVCDWIAKAKYLDLAILLNDPNARPGLGYAFFDYRKSRVHLTPELSGFLILVIILAAAICISIFS